ncbi:AbrB/MazE/SpoVT family DNA-binding domain-containing protein [Sphingomonas sp. RT2P30]|uniref:AbrB/MazE/SpoVT family DNA-binding domain-containing protein n=1 Tax=Parasphingomonas halimpatiens TaxID=3096162 RepID=UPI002FC9D3AB
MTRVIVGKWGKNLAVRVPFDIARSAGLSDGEEVDIVTQDGDILLRRSAAHAQRRRDAAQAAAEILADGKALSLKGLSVRDLRDEGRP